MNDVSVELETCWLNCESISLEDSQWQLTQCILGLEWSLILPLYVALDLINTWTEVTTLFWTCAWYRD